jgi:hypothetical protein
VGLATRWAAFSPEHAVIVASPTEVAEAAADQRRNPLDKRALISMPPASCGGTRVDEGRVR